MGEESWSHLDGPRHIRPFPAKPQQGDNRQPDAEPVDEGYGKITEIKIIVKGLLRSFKTLWRTLKPLKCVSHILTVVLVVG